MVGGATPWTRSCWLKLRGKVPLCSELVLLRFVHLMKSGCCQPVEPVLEGIEPVLATIQQRLDALIEASHSSKSWGIAGRIAGRKHGEELG